MALPVPQQASPQAPNPPGTGSMNPVQVAAPAIQGIQAPTGMPYGANKTLRGAQKAMPLPGPGAAPGGPPSGGGPPPGALMGAPAALAAAKGWNPPPTPLSAPSDRPGEPVTTGLASGSGAGPEALQGPSPPDPLVTGLAILNQIPNKDSETSNLAAVIQAMLGNRMAQ